MTHHPPTPTELRGMCVVWNSEVHLYICLHGNECALVRGIIYVNMVKSEIKRPKTKMLNTFILLSVLQIPLSYKLLKSLPKANQDILMELHSFCLCGTHVTRAHL